LEEFMSGDAITDSAQKFGFFRSFFPLARFFFLAILSCPSEALAAAGTAEPIVFVADSRRYSGWEAWFSNLYNESLLYFTILTVVTIPLVGVILGALTDFLMARIGINLRSRSVAEH
jgi:hypothetical protein